MKELKPHPIALAFPPMSDEEFEGLAEDIKKHGLRERVVVYQGKILEGVHRARACEKVGAKLHTQVFRNWGLTPVEFVIGANIHRRHLTKAQKADAIVAALKAAKDTTFAKTANVARKQGGGTQPGIRAKAADIGKKQGIGKRTIDEAMARAKGKKSKPKHETVEMNPTACELGLTADSSISNIIALVKRKLVFEFDGYCFSVIKH